MSHGEQSEQGTPSDGNHLESSSSRDVHRHDGEQKPLEQHEEHAAGFSPDIEQDEWQGSPQGLVERSISYQGPLPHSAELANYDSIAPGSAAKLIDAHVYEKRAGADALTRLTRAESFGVSFGAVVAGVLVIGGLLSGVYLVMEDKPLAAALFGALPVLGGSATGIISAVRGNGK